jgi:MoxR-like ATPase
MPEEAPMPTATLQSKFKAIEDQLLAAHFEREMHVHNAIVTLIGNQHMLMLGKPGTGKSLMIRDLAARILGGTYFETLLHETSDVSEVNGAIDVPAMVERGESRRNTKGKLPEATIGFIDEVLNGNAPVLHSLYPQLNERVFHNGGIIVPTPLRSCYMATNQMHSDPNLHALWDRVHIRMLVEYVRDRNNITSIIDASLNRKRNIAPEAPATVTIEELDLATQEALALPRSKDAEETFFGLYEELLSRGIEVSTRRLVESMVAAQSNAWLKGHAEVKVPDLEVLADFWWQTMDDHELVRGLILEAVNPSEKEATKLLEDFETLKQEYRKAEGLDEVKHSQTGLEVYRKLKALSGNARLEHEKAVDAGCGTGRLDEVIHKVQGLMGEIGKEVFGIDPSTMSDTE